MTNYHERRMASFVRKSRIVALWIKFCGSMEKDFRAVMKEIKWSLQIELWNLSLHVMQCHVTFQSNSRLDASSWWPKVAWFFFPSNEAFFSLFRNEIWWERMKQKRCFVWKSFILFPMVERPKLLSLYFRLLDGNPIQFTIITSFKFSHTPPLFFVTDCFARLWL